MGKHSLAAVLLPVAACAACGGISGVVQQNDADAAEDARLAEQAVGEAVDGAEFVELTPADVVEAADLWLPEAADSRATEGSAILPGEAGYACASPADCNDGFCIQTAQGKQCSMLCQEECPFGWVCVPYTPSRPDQVFICAPRLLDLCRPCKANSECKANDADAGQVCVDYGPAGAFCGESCQSHEDCPDGFACQTVTDVTGASAKQCFATEQECACSQKSIDDGAVTSCFTANDHGKCTGERKCVAGGLTPCSAATPAKEQCNELDDDCDSTVDEDTSGEECLVENANGKCPGFTVCLGGQIVCEGDEAKAETCDGVDNDCDGDVDEDFEDTDDDGIPDCLENDKDGDGIVDGLDNCPSLFNSNQKDFDLDLLGDACDPDDDNDLSPDAEDCAPFDAASAPALKETCDAKDNDCDSAVDEGFPDSDADGLKDCVDDDDDNDGTADGADCGPLDPLTHPAAAEECDGKDNDCDFSADEGFPDSDADGLADCVDADSDGDGVTDAQDNCPATPNTLQENLDGDSQGDACDDDADGDSIPDPLDNCKGLKNTLQLDTDKDGLGNDCDPDMDSDGIANETDNCLLVPNPGQADQDLDGTGDACEDDQDGDGAPDQLDCAPANPGIFPGATEVCDSADNDCDYSVDEGFPDADADGLKNCVDLDDDNDGDPDDNDCAPLDPKVNENALELCDGVDNDCNGKPDDGLGALVCGKGMCAHSVPACVAGKVQTCDPMQGASEEKCDGLDNDCDGIKDEDLGSTTCGLGVCAHSVPNCKNGEAVACDPLEGAAAEACDGLDNDCDGKTDEGMGTVQCGLGVCAHKISACIGGEPQECDPLQGATLEACDGLDNDCDGDTDEELGAVVCGKGACAHEQPYCENGKVTVCDPFLGVSEEVCDASDNDCNGLTDEGMGILSCGLGLCAHTVPACLDGVPQVCEPLEGASPEVCDGIDNDCDGLVDESLGLLTCGLGQCLHTVQACLDGAPQECNPLDGATDESCDGMDNDCDGFADPEDSTGCSPYFLDSDSDGYGLPGEDKCLCVAKAPYTAPVADDCDDGDPAINPAGKEICTNAADENCNGKVNDGCVYASCKEILTFAPAAGSGMYTIDPDGSGGNAAFEVYCDMTGAGGGWTRVAFENFEAPVSGWSWTNQITSCGSFGNILAGYGVTAGGTNEKTFTLLSIPHTQARVTLDYIKIDSWDGESAYVRVDGVQIYGQAFCFCSQGCQNNNPAGICGGAAECGGGWDEERSLPVDGVIAHTSNSVLVSAQSTIDQGASDESWGLDNVAVYVR